MLVEDNPSFRQLVKNNLQDQFPSMDIIEAADGVEALQKIDSHPPNLIFMDIRLPGENGLELTRKIKTNYPDIIIIILTRLSFLRAMICRNIEKQRPKIRLIISFRRTQ